MNLPCSTLVVFVTLAWGVIDHRKMIEHGLRKAAHKIAQVARKL